jgi:hypothetical protein
VKHARISTLHRASKERPAGYLEACLRAGKVSADGEWVEFSDAAHARLVRQFNPIRAAHDAEKAMPGRAQDPALAHWRAAVHRRPCGGVRAP